MLVAWSTGTNRPSRVFSTGAKPCALAIIQGEVKIISSVDGAHHAGAKSMKSLEDQAASHARIKC